MPNIVFFSPHMLLSGGTKVISRLAEGLKNRGWDTCIVVDNPIGNYEYVLNRSIPLLITNRSIAKTNGILNNADVVINFCDGQMFKPKNGRSILYLQGYGTMGAGAEKAGIEFKHDAIICTSQWLYQVAKIHGHKNVEIAHPGIDSVFFNAPTIPHYGMKVVGSLYHKAGLKNSSHFSAAMDILHKKLGKNIHSMYFSARDVPQVQTTNYPHAFCINAPQNLVPAMYSACDVFVATSLNEGWGLTPLEAMACKIPVVMYKNKGLDFYLVDGENCLIAKNPQEIAHKCMDLFNNTALKNKIISGGFKLASQFTWDACVTTFENVLKNLRVPK